MQAVVVTRTSFRPVPAEDRESSWRKDDRLLHVDAFPSRPNRGERILRVFTNINPDGEPRVWHIGEPFEDVAAQDSFPAFAPPLPGTSYLLAALGITRGERSAYDHIMLQLHDRMKSDAAYQLDAPQTEQAFPPGSTWVCFSDQVSHAVVRGQFMLEQTLQLPVAAMYHPDRAPISGARAARRTRVGVSFASVPYRPSLPRFALAALLAAALPSAHAATGEKVVVPWRAGNADAFQTGAAEERPGESGARISAGYDLPPRGPGPLSDFVVLLAWCAAASEARPCGPSGSALGRPPARARHRRVPLSTVSGHAVSNSVCNNGVPPGRCAAPTMRTAPAPGWRSSPT